MVKVYICVLRISCYCIKDTPWNKIFLFEFEIFWYHIKPILISFSEMYNVEGVVGLISLQFQLQKHDLQHGNRFGFGINIEGK